MHGRHIRPLRSIAEVLRMFARRWCAVLLILLSGVPVAIEAQQPPEICTAAIPANADAGVFRREMLALLRQSDTFRSQCERLAHSPHVRVTITTVFSLPNGRAQTVIHRFAAGAIHADVM